MLAYSISFALGAFFGMAVMWVSMFGNMKSRILIIALTVGHVWTVMNGETSESVQGETSLPI